MHYAIHNLDLKDKIAHLMTIDIPGPELEQETLEHLSERAWGGVILFDKNIRDRQQTVELIRNIHQAIPTRPLISVDQEGGLVNRFRFSEMNLSPGAMALAATKDLELTQKVHRVMAEEMHSLWVHLDFAPCIDVNNNPNNPIIGVRSFGACPEQVSRFAEAAVKGLQQGKVAPTIKHFPGHGDTHLDSHLTLPTVAHNRERLEEIELAPYRALIKQGCEVLMTAHILYPALESDPECPATLSRTILTDLLRDELGFQGVIATDSLAMHAIAHNIGIEEAAIKSLEAGADMILPLGSFDDHLKVVGAIEQAVLSGRLSESRIDESVQRIMELKKSYPAEGSDQVPYDRESNYNIMKEAAQRSVTVHQKGSSSLPCPPKTLLLAPDSLPLSPLGEMQENPGLKNFYPEELGWTERRYHPQASGLGLHPLLELAQEHDQVVLMVYSRSQLPETTLELYRRLKEVHPSLIFVSLSSPYLSACCDEQDTIIFTYNYTPLSLQALADLLQGTLQATGTCPVPI